MSDAPLPTELHWLAGLLEGEGSFMVGPLSNLRMPIISVSINGEDIWPGWGGCFGRKVYVVKRRNEHWQTSYQLRVQGGAAVRWMTILRPLMGARRQAQIDRAIASYDPRPTARLNGETARAALARRSRGARRARGRRHGRRGRGAVRGQRVVHLRPATRPHVPAPRPRPHAGWALHGAVGHSALASGP